MPDNPDNVVPLTGDAKRVAQEFGAAHDRELLTILFTDLVDSTKLQSEAGNIEAARLTELHREIVRDELAQYDAREIEWAGDSCLAVFTKPSDAVVFALRMQAEHRRVRETEPKLPLVRVGMHLGEVVVKKRRDGGKKTEDLFGLQVSEAARVMSVARGDQVFCTRAVFDNAQRVLKGQQVDGVGDVVWVNYGAYLLKGSADPVELCEIGSASLPVMKAPETNDKVAPVLPGGVEAMRALIPYEGTVARARKTPRWALAVAAMVLLAAGAAGYGLTAQLWQTQTGGPVESLAVLPLDNFSDDPEQQYFVDGMTDALTAELSKVGSIKVIARTSSMRFKDSGLSIQEIARELGVDGLIEGSVFRSGDDVRVTAQLVRGDTEEHVWGETYEESIQNVLKLQGRMAVEIVKGIRAALSAEEEARMTMAETTNSQAYDAYLRGQNALRNRNRAAFETAVTQFQLALEYDPGFAPAYAGLGQVYSLQLGYGMGDADTLREQSRAASHKALEIDPESADAHAALGLSHSAVSTEPGNWREAEKHLREAIRLQPGLAVAHMWLGMLYTEIGRLDDGQAALEKAVELDPLGSVPKTLLAENRVYRREYDEAESLLNEVLEDDPTSLLAAMHLHHVYSGRGYTKPEVERMQSFLERLDGGNFFGLRQMLMAARARMGETGPARAAVAEVEEEDGVLPLAVPFAEVWFALGEREKGFEWLQKGEDVKTFWPFLRNAPNWDFLRDDDRYWAFMQDLGFPPVAPEHPLYEQEQAWLRKEAAEAALAAAPKPVRRVSITLPQSQPAFPNPGVISVSPDGETIVYTAGEPPGTRLIKRRFDQLDGDVIPGTEGAGTHAFSPDGEWLCFAHPIERAIKKVKLDSGSPVVLAPNPGVVLPLAWGDDGYIVFSMYGAGDRGPCLFRIPESGGEPERLTTLADGELAHAAPVVLPGGDFVVFVLARSFSPEGLAMAAHSRTTGEHRTLLDSAYPIKYLNSGYLVYGSAGQLMAAPFDAARAEFTGPAITVTEPGMSMNPLADAPDGVAFSENGTLAHVLSSEEQFSGRTLYQLVWVDHSGVETTIDVEPHEFVAPRMSPDGRYVALMMLDPGFRSRPFPDIWVCDLERGTQWPLTFDDLFDGLPVWSPDGARIFFTSDRNPSEGRAYWKAANGTTEAHLLYGHPSLGLGGPYDVTPDGRQVVCGSSLTLDHRNLVLVSLEGDEEPRVLVDNGFRNRLARFSPDGNWIAYNSDESGRVEIFVQDFPAMEERYLISTAGGADPIWSPDGKELYYRDGESVVAVSIDTEPEFRAGKPQPLFQDTYLRLTGERSFPAYDLAPDGERFLMIKPVEQDEVEEPQGSTEIAIVENWIEEVNRLAPVPGAN